MSPFLKRCQCSRGFFTLRPCDAPGTQTCAACQRSICDEHWKGDATPPRCLECVARASEARALDDDYDYDDVWFHRYRHRYYMSHSYRPFYYGPAGDPYYNDYDLRPFDQQNAAVDDGSDDRDEAAGGGGLGDS